MGKCVFLTTVVLFVLLACIAREKGGVDAVSAATERKGPPARVLLEKFMPDAAADGTVKIAVVVNQQAGDRSQQLIEGCVSEGRSMGFTVDSFVTGGDERRCGELLARVVQADYDGLVFAYAESVAGGDGTAGGGEAFSYDALRPAAEKGIPIVTFEALPVKGGRTINGITATFLDDYGLARLSLDVLLSALSSVAGTDRPARIIRIGTEAGVPFMVRRARVFDDYLSEGKIEEAALVNLRNLENPAAAAREGLVAILSRFPPGSVDAVWSPYDECSVGCAEAIAAAGRGDIKLISIGISNDDLRLMQRYSDIWLASAAVDPQLAGTVNMRILAAKLAGETPPGTFSFGPQLVKTADLNCDINTANIAVMVPGWGDGKGLFDYYQWMKDLKEAEARYLRIPPPARTVTDRTAVPLAAAE